MSAGPLNEQSLNYRHMGLESFWTFVKKNLAIGALKHIDRTRAEGAHRKSVCLSPVIVVFL